MLRQPYFAYYLLVVLSALVGCNRDLGECNLDGTTDEGRPIQGPAALDLVYRDPDGLPMYEGQALVQSSCGNGQSCHSPAAVGSERVGVPAGLNFDVALACDATVDSTCADLESCQGANAESAYCERLQRLESNRSYTASWGEGIISQLRRGSMPPGEAGRRVRDNRPWFRPEPDGSQLPPIGSGEAEEIVRNWLACAAPVVARTEFPPSEEDELKSCDPIDGETCVYSGPQGVLPEPMWSSIYASLIFNECLICHGPANSNVDQNPNNLGGAIPGGANSQALDALNLSGADPMDTSNWAADSHMAVFDVLASAAGECEGQGTIVVPNNSADSLMIQKLRAIQTCGSEMPIAVGNQTISDAVIQVVEEWIDMGAPNN